MTTLQEAARKSFEVWKKTRSCFYLSRNNAPGSDLDGYQDAYTQGQWIAWQAALAQQGEPVAQARLGMKDGLAMALSVVELYGMKGDVIYREIAKLRDGIAAAPAPQPAQDVKDAERYRWLREQHWSTDTIAVVLNPKQAVKLGYVCPSDSLLDETIDAAIAKGAK